jgi:hypothetical protein
VYVGNSASGDASRALKTLPNAAVGRGAQGKISPAASEAM